MVYIAGENIDGALVSPGDVIVDKVDVDSGILCGHGTQTVDGRLLSTVCGTVQRISKLVSVQPLRSRYFPETGDVVLGRVSGFIVSRWKLDIYSHQESILPFSAIVLPGGTQSRQSTVDELKMHHVYSRALVLFTRDTFLSEMTLLLKFHEFWYSVLALL